MARRSTHRIRRRFRPGHRSNTGGAILAAFTFLLLGSVNAHGREPDSARLYFEEGSRAFEAQAYDEALAAFETAAAAGLSGPAVHYNIGVSAYRSGDYAKAAGAFEEVARTPAMAALAHYNLGLVALRRNDRDAAERWFSLAERGAEDERLRQLAATQLDDLRVEPARRSWTGFAAIGGGYDDNVALTSDGNLVGISGRDDTYAELQLAASGALREAWRLDAGAVYVDYTELDRFDQLAVSGGARYSFRAGKTSNEAGVHGAHVTLDGEGFESTATLSLQTSVPIRPGLRVRARYRLSDVEGRGEFVGITGTRNEGTLRADWRLSTWGLGVEYRIDVSDCEDDALCATRHQLGTELRWTPLAGWTFGLEAARRRSCHDVAEDSNRVEHRTTLAVAAARTLSDRWRLVARFDHTDNDAGIEEFNFRRNRVSAGFDALF